MAMLSPSEAFNFLQDILKMTSIHEKLTTDKAAFLNELVSLYLQHIPFQSFTVISRPDKDQHLSTMDDIKADIFATRGGLCYDHNIFMANLLEALGFDVCLIGCDIGMHGIHDHVSVLVQNLKTPGDRYHVDVGSGNPLFRAICMDFNQESPIYKSGYLTHKFTKDGDEFSWWHQITHTAAPSKDDVTVDGWRKFMTFTLVPRDKEYFRQYMLRHFVTQEHPEEEFSFLTALRAVVYPNKQLVAIRNSSLLLEDDEGNVEKTKIKSKEELLQLCVKYFPQFSYDMLQVVVNKMEHIF
ncbi:arylamine N-acetyltransferase-like [Amphiura filiformis]|uniref:arylamine N-acetyltransferase-like n=1 Tax=Amphiura filiformis TaxID=82378 RepID=UPI003B21DFDC